MWEKLLENYVYRLSDIFLHFSNIPCIAFSLKLGPLYYIWKNIFFCSYFRNVFYLIAFLSSLNPLFALTMYFRQVWTLQIIILVAIDQTTVYFLVEVWGKIFNNFLKFLLFQTLTLDSVWDGHGHSPAQTLGRSRSAKRLA